MTAVMAERVTNGYDQLFVDVQAIRLWISNGVEQPSDAYSLITVTRVWEKSMDCGGLIFS
nr:hypothetical protein [Granulicella aggregans]